MAVMGLCRGRHEMPAEVQEYVFEQDIKDPTDFRWMEKHVFGVLYSKLHVDLSQHTQGLQQDDYTDIRGWHGQSLTLYVTGLTAAAMAVASFCAKYGCSLTLMHYDRQSGDYKPQILWHYI